MKHFLNDALDLIQFIFLDPLIVLCLILLGICLFVLNESEKSKMSPEVYQAWTQTNPQHQMSYEQWVRLYKSGVLPGQQSQQSSPMMYPVVVPMPSR